MSNISLAALAATAVLLAAMPSALAGDLGDGGYGAAPYGHHRPYYSGDNDGADRNDGRYDRNYGDDDDDDDDDDGDDRRAYSHSGNDDDDDYRDQRDDTYAPRHNGSTKHDYAPNPRADMVRPHRAGCLPGWQVKKRLIAQGWSDFQLKTYGQSVAVIRATRAHTGRAFILRVDGCTGETLSSVPSGTRHFSDGRPKPRRYSWRD